MQAIPEFRQLNVFFNESLFSLPSDVKRNSYFLFRLIKFSKIASLLVLRSDWVWLFLFLNFQSDRVACIIFNLVGVHERGGGNPLSRKIKFGLNFINSFEQQRNIVSWQVDTHDFIHGDHQISIVFTLIELQRHQHGLKNRLPYIAFRIEIMHGNVYQSDKSS